MKKQNIVSLAIGSTIAAITLAPGVQAAENPFGANRLESGYQLAQADGKTKDGRCGGDKKMEAKCGADKKTAEAKCGAEKKKDASCGAAKKSSEAKCGADKKKDASCGASK